MSNHSLWVYSLAFVFISVIVITYGGQREFGKVNFNEVDVKGSLEAKDATVGGFGVTGDSLTVGSRLDSGGGTLSATGSTFLSGKVNGRGLALGVGLTTGFIATGGGAILFVNAINGSSVGGPQTPEGGILALPPAFAGRFVRYVQYVPLTTATNGSLTFQTQPSIDTFSTNNRIYVNADTPGDALVTVSPDANNTRLVFSYTQVTNIYFGIMSEIDFVCTIDGIWEVLIRPRPVGDGSDGQFQWLN